MTTRFPPSSGQPITANELRALLREHAARDADLPEPCRIVGRTLAGDVILSAIDLRFPLEFVDCAASAQLSFSSATLRGLRFLRCHLGEVDLSGAVIHGNVAFTECRVERGVRLEYTSIGGYLDFESVHATLAEGDFLSAQRLKVDGVVRFLDAHVAGGSIDLANTSLGVLRMHRARLSRKEAVMVDLSDARIEGALDCATDFECEGTINLAGARVGSNVYFTGARLLTPGKVMTTDKELADPVSIFGDRLSVGGDVFLNGGFSADGEIRFLAAEIGGDLSCEKGRFSTPVRRGDAICCANAKIQKNAYFDHELTSRGRINLFGCEVGGDVRFERSMCDAFHSPSAIDMNQAVVRGEVRITASDISGQVDLSRSEIGTLDLGPPKTKDTMSLDLRQAHARVLKDAVTSWPGYRYYDLTGFRYDSLFMNDGWDVERCLVWLARSGDGKFSPQPYEQLASVQRMSGLADDAKRVLVAREQRRPASWPRPVSLPGQAFWLFRKFLHGAYGKVVRYGYRPARAFIWAFVLWLIGTVVIAAALQQDAFFQAKARPAAATAPGMAVRPDPQYPRLVAPVYSLEVMVPFLKLHQEEYWLPDHSKWAGIAAQGYLWLHNLAGWILGTFLVASVGSLVRRD